MTPWHHATIEIPAQLVEKFRIQVLFISRVFKGMKGDYPVSQNFSNRFFTRPGFERIILIYPHKSPTH
jgi:hypothetical protein